MLKKQDNFAPVIARKVSLVDLVDSVESWPVPCARSFAICIRTLLQNWRQGTVGCKGRSDVSFSNKKPWKQKGTGRARAGSKRSPLWRGGGVTFGPQMRDRKLKVSKGMRRGVLRGLVSSFADQQKVVMLDWLLQLDRPKTSMAYSALRDAGLTQKKVLLFLPVSDVMTAASFANIPNVHIMSFDEPNVYHLANAASWLILERDLESFKEMVAKWS